MSSEQTTAGSAIGVGVVGVKPGEQDGILAVLPQGDRFQFVAFSDEGLEDPGSGERPVRFYWDYNMLVQDPAVELVLVDGPLEKRRDFAVRALNADCHVVIRGPFCETAMDAERVMKTAIRAGLVATMDLAWRDQPDLLALRRALAAENVGAVHGLFGFWPGEEPADAGAAEGGLLAQLGLALLDQMNLLLNDDAKSVNAHLQTAMPGRPDEGFLVYLPLRRGGWAIGQASRHGATHLPRWVLYTANAVFSAGDGRAHVVTGGQRRTYEAPDTGEDFWQNLYASIRHGADLKCHPVDIVRAMKLHEAALESAEVGKPVTV